MFTINFVHVWYTKIIYIAIPRTWKYTVYHLILCMLYLNCMHLNTKPGLVYQLSHWQYNFVTSKESIIIIVQLDAGALERCVSVAGVIQL